MRKNMEGSGRSLIEALSQHLPGWIEESLRITSVPVEIRIEHL
jgi:hypothetical protein